MGKSSSKSRPGGFTVAELMISLCIMAMVLLALSAIAMAVSQGWQQSEENQALSVQAVQLQLRLQRALEGAKYIAQFSQGSVNGTAATPAQIFYWQADANGDGIPQLGEMALIQHDPSTGSLYLYTIPVSSLTASQLITASQTMTYALMSASSAPTSFKSLNFVQKTVLCGPGTNLDSGEHPRVTGLRFDVQWMDDVNQLAVVEFQLNLMRGTGSWAIYGSATLRGPTTRPS